MANMTTIRVALWGEKTALLLVLEVVLDCMFCEMRISVGQETFTKVHVNRTVVDCFLGGLSLCRVEGVYLYSICIFLTLNPLLFLNRVYKSITINDMLSLLTLLVMFLHCKETFPFRLTHQILNEKKEVKPELNLGIFFSIFLFVI